MPRLTFRLEDAVRTERDTLKFRFLTLLVIVVALAFLQEEIPLIASVALVVGYLAYAGFVNQFLLPRYPNLLVLSLMLLVDTGTLMAALRLIGLDSPVFIFLPVLIVYYSLYMGYVGSLTAATLISLGYALLVQTVETELRLQNIVSFQIPLFYMVALLTGYLSGQRFKELEEKRTLQQLIGVETHTRGVMDLVRRFQQALDPQLVGRDLAHLGALIAGVPVCILFRWDPEGDRLVGLASNDVPATIKLGSVGLLSEPLEGMSPGARIMRRETAHIAQSLPAPEDLPEWASPQWAKSLVAVSMSQADAAPIGVVYFLHTQPNVPATDTIDHLHVFGSLAGNLLGRIEARPEVERRSTRLIGELRRTVEGLGRFRDLQGRPAIRLNSIVIDPAEERLTIGGTRLPLSKTEFDVLYLLVEKRGTIVSQETLLREVWGEDFVPQGNVVDVCVHRLRRKLARTSEGHGLIRTVRGRGYMVQPPRP